jgi:hypothetical protein
MIKGLFLQAGTEELVLDDEEDPWKDVEGKRNGKD